VNSERQVTPILVRWVYVGMVGYGALFGLLQVWSLATWTSVDLQVGTQEGSWAAAAAMVEAGLASVP
jgi:hypothetical protein